MPWVRFTGAFDWRDPRMMRRLVAYKAGQIKMVTTPCSIAAFANGKAVRSSRKGADMTLVQAREKIAQAYQVIGVFAHISSGDPPLVKITDDEMLRAQDYFAADEFDAAFLPWPRSSQ